jgi:hypothetical protein
MDKYVVVSVSNILQREKVIKKIYSNLTGNLKADPATKLRVVQDQVNRIRIYHYTDNVNILIRTYLVIVIPLMLDLNPIYSIVGDVTFELSETIKNLKDLTSKLENLQGHSIRKGNTNAQTLTKLVNSLS